MERHPTGGPHCPWVSDGTLLAGQPSSSWDHLACIIREPEEPRRLSHCPQLWDSPWPMTRMPGPPCFAPSQTLHSVSASGDPYLRRRPSSNPIKIWLDLRIWDYEELDSLNIPSPPFDTGSTSCAPTFPFPLETDILTTYTQGKAQRNLPCARTWCEQENRNWGF